jgi:hypothetical protein
LQNIEELDNYYKGKFSFKTDDINTINSADNLGLNKKLKSKIDEILKDGIYQLDFIVLFYISFFDLSTEFKKYLSSNKINIRIENVVKNCNNLLKNPIVIKSGIFAFLELLDKLFEKLNLDSKNVKIMDIQNINNLHNINDVLNSLDSEIVEK